MQAFARRAAAALAFIAGSQCTLAGPDWTNSGGNIGHNGQSSHLGPDAADVLWATPQRSSIISWLPVIEGRRLFTVRQSGFPPEPPAGTSSTIVCIDLDTGAELWHANLPFQTGDWTTWVGGVMNGKVYASRGGNGASSSAVLYCLDAATGAVLWDSDEEIDAGAYDGMTFAPDGDPIIGSFRFVWRIDSADGHTVWKTPRLCSVSGSCGGAATDDAVYIADAAPGGNILRRLDMATGSLQYDSPVMAGFLVQNTPFVGPDGTVYFHRVQTNALVDFFYAWQDTGSQFVAKWNVPGDYTTGCEFTVGPDGSVYVWAPDNVIQRLDVDTGMVLDTSPVIPADFATIRMAADRAGRIYVSNGAFSNGRLYCFAPDLQVIWSVGVPNINIGGPAIGADGTLIACSVGTTIRAYRTPRDCEADLSGSSDPNDPAYGVPDGAVDAADFFYYLDQFASGNLAEADLSGSSDPNDPAYGVPDGQLDSSDFFYYLDLFVAGCP